MVVEPVETTMLNHYDKLETTEISQWTINPEGFREQLANSF